MDKELKEILNKLLEGQTRLETELNNTSSRVGNMERELSNTSSRVKNMEKELSNTSSRVENMENRVEKMEKELNNNSIKLEDVEKKIKVIAEIQVAHKEQNERYLKDILQEQHNIKELKEKFDKVEKVTIQNTYDVAYLKSVK